MSVEADRHAEEQDAIRAALPTGLINEFRLAAYWAMSPEDGYLVAGIHLAALVREQLIEPRGSLTSHGEEMLQNLSTIATWNRRHAKPA